MKAISCLCAVLMALTISGCASTTPEDVLKGQGHHAAKLSIREHVFASQPLWESSILKAKNAVTPELKFGVDNLSTVAPGLAALRAQAEGKTPESFVYGPARAKVKVNADELPPPSLVSTPVMKAFIDAMTAEVIGEYWLRHGQPINDETKKLIDRTLTFQDFWDFRVELAKAGVAVFQDTPDAKQR